MDTRGGATRIQAPPSWQVVDFIADLHLQASQPQTHAAFLRYLQQTPADALFILGDLFEVWIGDDALADTAESGFLQQCCAALREWGERHALHFLVGNRDFLAGPGFLQACAARGLADPVRLDCQGGHWLLSHGDALCLADHDYMAFRRQVRSDAWQQAFLAQPLAQRQSQARALREQSEARKAEQRMHPEVAWVDADADLAATWLRTQGCQTLIHGHTHRPAEHPLPDGLRRVVLSDWDAQASPPRLQVLRMQHGAVRRVDLAP